MDVYTHIHTDANAIYTCMHKDKHTRTRVHITGKSTLFKIIMGLEKPQKV